VAFGQSAHGTGFAVAAMTYLCQHRYGLAIFFFHIQDMKLQTTLVGELLRQSV